MDRSWPDSEIAILAEKLRKRCGISSTDRFDVMRLVKILQEQPNRLARVTFIPMTRKEPWNSPARAEPKNRIIRYQPQLMEDALNGDAKANEVLLEEIGHVLMHSSSIALDHSVGADRRALNNPLVQEREREAQKFVWYALAPISEVYGQSDPVLLSTRWGLTDHSAKLYVDHLRRTKNQIEKRGRPVPADVVDFFEEAKKKGYSVKTPLNPVIGNGVIDKVADGAQTLGDLPTPAPGFLAEECTTCHRKTLRILGGCKQCLCGDSQGCN